MPEGNEVHRYADLQNPIFTGRTLAVSSPNKAFADAKLLDGRKLKGIEAFGKHLLYDFGLDHILHVHLGRFGKFRDGEMPFPTPQGALRLRMSSAKNWLELRGPTACEVFDTPSRQALLDRIGPDPLRADAKPKAAMERIIESRSPIGALLMDQSVIAGIGNIYRAELLFRARLSPFRPGLEVELSALKKIWREAKTLLAAGMVDRRIVTTLPKDRPHKQGIAKRGETHYVYRRDGLPCFVCGTKVLTKVFVGRDLYWCPNCQAR